MICEKCNNEHDGSYASGRFCNKSCAKGFSNFKTRVCKICCVSFVGKMSYISHMKVHSSPLSWENVKCDGTRKKRLIEERGYKCEICKLEKWLEKQIPLELDHIDGHPEHNEKDNLRLICPNCHAQTEHYRGRNANHHSGTLRQNTVSKYPDYRLRNRK